MVFRNDVKKSNREIAWLFGDSMKKSPGHLRDLPYDTEVPNSFMKLALIPKRARGNFSTLQNTTRRILKLPMQSFHKPISPRVAGVHPPAHNT